MTTVSRGLVSWLETARPPEEDGETTARMRLVAAATGESALTRRVADEGEIAKGYNTSIRRVFDLRLRRHVAMKVLDPRLVRAPRDVARFQEEARITGALDHSHIPPIYDLGTDEESTHYFTMKLVEGLSLQALLADPAYSPLVDAKLLPALEALVRTCDAVAFAHAKGVVHCDLRPVNVIVGEHGQVTVMDWSAARLLPGASISGVDALARAKEPGWAEPSAEAGKVLESAGYMAPEQAKGDVGQITAQTDVFCIGAMLYHAITGRPPYPGPDLRRLLEQATEGVVTPPWELAGAAATSRRLGEIAMRALSVDPAARYPSVVALRTDIDSWIRGDGRAVQKTFAPGSLLIREGETGDAAFVVMKGRCRVFKTIDGARFLIREVGVGDVIGETAIFGSQPRGASVEAIDTVTASVVNRASLELEMGRTFWVSYLVRALAQRFREVDEKATRLEQVNEEMALAREILMHMVIYGAQVPWNALRVALCRKFKRSGPDTQAIAQRLPMFAIDMTLDLITMLVEPPPPQKV